MQSKNIKMQLLLHAKRKRVRKTMFAVAFLKLYNFIFFFFFRIIWWYYYLCNKYNLLCIHLKRIIFSLFFSFFFFAKRRCSVWSEWWTYWMNYKFNFKILNETLDSTQIFHSSIYSLMHFLSFADIKKKKMNEIYNYLVRFTLDF